MAESKTSQAPGAPNLPAQKLLISGFVHLEQQPGPVELRREMLIWAQDGQEVGRIAAVAWQGHNQAVSHILLGRVPPTSGYRLIPVSLIAQVNQEGVWLRLTAGEIEAMPLHQPEG